MGEDDVSRFDVEIGGLQGGLSARSELNDWLLVELLRINFVEAC